MAKMDVKPLQDDLSFGVRIGGVTRELLEDAGVRQQIVDLFEDKGMIIFEDVEPSSQMHLALSTVFGPLKEHPNKAVARVDGDTMPGVIDMRVKAGEGGVVELNGRRLSSWLPWHFDHCYNNELNRAGVLRAIEVAPEGGLTGFCDGIDLYKSLSPDLLARIEGKNILYRLDVEYGPSMRFGRPAGLVEVVRKPGAQAVMEAAKGSPRAIHPAVWTRKSGEKVLHVSPWMSQGVQGAETEDGEALLEAVCQEINTKAKPYFHRWNLTDMLIWDNWRMLHSVSGMDPAYSRRMQRTTIKGDYGLGFFEGGGTGDKILEMTV
ncbi:TauD/TfdA family dioxygenase [Phenylobacterium sp. LjRoot225]|uniref:TauD/TfdA dioxygenase family protein n=1 Tax=Phenylobacterium sp. LjRoot225 TaxID=3342285 RepID=UPI003ECC8D82